MRRFLIAFVMFLWAQLSWASYILIPMDNNQANHLKAYGIAYWILQNDIDVDWLLIYRGGSFMFKYYQNNIDISSLSTV